MNQYQASPLERVCWDVTATVRWRGGDVGVDALLVDELRAACAPTLGRVRHRATVQLPTLKGQPCARRATIVQVCKPSTWVGCEAAAVAARLRTTALALWRAGGRWTTVHVEARSPHGVRLTQRFDWRDGLVHAAGDCAGLPSAACDPAAPSVELELEVTTYDGRAEAVRMALERAGVWQWDAQPYGLLGRARGPLPLPFGRFVQALGARVWSCSPGAGVLLYVHAAGVRLVLERALGLPDYLAWARAHAREYARDVARQSTRGFTPRSVVLPHSGGWLV